MNFRHGLASIFKTIGWAVTLGVAMSACSQASWKEEVLLSDGRKIVVERSVERGGRHEIGQEPPISMQILRFKLPVGGNEIEWKTETSPGIGWADFQPLNVDIVANNAYVVTWPVGCLAYNKWGRPNPPYIVFKHTGKAWQQIPLKDLPSEIKVPNIIFGSPDTNAKQLDKGTISAAAVREVNGRLEQPEFKSILREKLPEAKILADCEVRVQYKGRWILPNDPIARKFIDSQEQK